MGKKKSESELEGSTTEFVNALDVRYEKGIKNNA